MLAFAPLGPGPTKKPRTVPLDGLAVAGGTLTKTLITFVAFLLVHFPRGALNKPGVTVSVGVEGYRRLQTWYNCW